MAVETNYCFRDDSGNVLVIHDGSQVRWISKSGNLHYGTVEGNPLLSRKGVEYCKVRIADATDTVPAQYRTLSADSATAVKVL